MNNLFVSLFRGLAGILPGWLLLTVFLGGCAGSYLQGDSTKYPDDFNHQDLIGKHFETTLPITVYKLRNSRFLALHEIPLAIVVADKKNSDLIYYDSYPLTTLPPGTVLEMVGEMVWQASPTAINAQPAQNFDYFIVHDQPGAQDLLLPFPGWLTQAGLRGQTLRPHIQADYPEPFLLEVDVPSQWTCARYDMIDGAEWHKGLDLKLSRRVVHPVCEEITN